jgi:hypothetical protein
VLKLFLQSYTLVENLVADLMPHPVVSTVLVHLL